MFPTLVGPVANSGVFIRVRLGRLPVVGSSGLEPPTSRLSGARSNLLSYEPVFASSSSVHVALAPQPYGSGLPHPARLPYSFGCLYLSFTRALPAGGDDGIRTHDPLLAGQVLSQLSYTPVYRPSGTVRGSLKIEQRLALRLLFTRA